MPGIYCFANQFGWNNQQLTKNCGVLPYIFYKNFGFHAVMVTGHPGEFPALDTYVRGMRMDILPSPSDAAHIQYIEEHAADIDVFVMHSPFPMYLPLLKRYKELRPDGKIYLELDANSLWMDNMPCDVPSFRHMLGMCDVIGASCRRIQRYLMAKWHVDIDFLPNGFYNFAGMNLAVDFAAKENIILTVGRIGTRQKQNEVLLEAFAMVADKIPDWRVELVGNIDPTFHGYIEQYFVTHPELKNRVLFRGAIQDKAKLMNLYKKAKIFALTSELEGGAPNVAAEALYGGCYMITSGIDAADDMIDEGRCGDVFPLYDARALSAILTRVCNDPSRLAEGGQRALVYGHKYFDFEKIAARLHYLLYKR